MFDRFPAATAPLSPFSADYPATMPNYGDGPIFVDRIEAGKRLAQALSNYQHEDNVVVALPRGGVTVAAEVARKLKAPMELVIARKLGAPMQPEFAIGAIAPLGVRIIDADSVAWLGLPEEELDRIADQESAEMKRRQTLYGSDKDLSSLRGKRVILVDDGVATGLTVQAAVRSIKMAGARRIVVAVPVCSQEAKRMLEAEADEVVALSTPEPFFGVAAWYDDFSQVTDEEVQQLVLQAGQASAAQGA